MFKTFYRNCFNEVSQGPGRGLRSSSNQPASNGSSNSRPVLRSLYGISGLIALCYILTGCGAQMTTSGSVSQGSFSASPSTVDFGSVSVGGSANSSVSLVNSSSDPVVVSKLSISGNSKFTLVDDNQLPLTLAAGTTTSVKVHYGPTAAASDSGTLSITSNSTTVPTASVKLHGQGLSGTSSTAVSALTCTAATVTGVGTDSCTATISSAAPSGGFSIGLGSSSAVLTVPSSVSVPANATTVSFSATAAAVTSAQSIILTASGGGTTKSFTVQLKPGSVSSGGGGTLAINSTTVAFGNVMVGSPATQSVTLTATGSAVTVSSATTTGTGFAVSGAKFPMTVNPGSPATLNIAFSPTSAGAASGKLTIANNSSNLSSASITLSGTGTTHEIALNWTAPTETTDPAVGYKVYRTTSGSSSYTLLNSSATSQTTFTDTTAASGATYQYYVTSVDSAGAESTPSNTATVAVP